MTSPTQRSLAWLRKRGWTASVVEKWNHVVHIRQDLFGFADVLAFRNGEPVLLLQVCSSSGGDVASRKTKISQNAVAALWLEAGHAIDIHGWAKRGPRGKRKLWTLRRVQALWNPNDNVNPITFVEQTP